jgi:hypothetical protein
MTLELRPFVVTGCARSGTAYMAVTLTRLGLQCGHEVVFGPRTRAFTGFHGQHGDSSWLAAPFLEQLPPDTLVLHRIRHPLRVVRSLLGVKFFQDRANAWLWSDDAYTRSKWQVRRALMAAGHVEASAKGPRPHTAYRGFLNTYAPQVWAEPTPAHRALRYWADWNRLVEQQVNDAGLTYRRHLVEHYDDESLAADLACVGLPVTPDHVRLVTAAVPRDTNSRRVTDDAWDDLPDSPAKEAATELAQRYGYDPRTPR